jgi:hypothetical protein
VSVDDADESNPPVPNDLPQLLPCSSNTSATDADKEDDLEAMIAGAPGGKLHVSLDSFHELPAALRNALKRSDSRVVAHQENEVSA